MAHTTYGGVKGKPAGVHGGTNKRSSLVGKEVSSKKASGYPRKGKTAARVKNATHNTKMPNNK